MNTSFVWPSGFEDNKFYSLYINEFELGQEMTLTSNTYNTSLIKSISCPCLTIFRSLQASKLSAKSSVTNFPPFKSLCDNILPCRTIGQGQSNVMIFTNYNGPEFLMLYAKFR